MDFSESTLTKVQQLKEKYTALGQNLDSYLDGLLHAEFLTYWDYIHLDTLLSLQSPKTAIPDERIFIIYHQITELYFKLSLQAIELAAHAPALTPELLLRQVKRVNSYIDHLVSSFDLMVDGMDKDEFLKFRMSLLPASGFQSGQYRMIEICSTDMEKLVHFSQRENLRGTESLDELYDLIYWKRGATELATGQKTLTLKQFERKYGEYFIKLAKEYEYSNIWQLYERLLVTHGENAELKEELRRLDLNANVRWNLAHYRSAVRYLDRKPKEIAATGGTNWQDYLPPKNQRVIFFPSLWTDEELDNWGKFVS